MKLKQTDQSEGFSELLEVAGSEFTWREHPLTALIRTLQPKVEGFDLTPCDDNSVSVRALRSVFLGGLPAIGDHFEDESGTSYRVTRISRIPGDLTVTFECEVLHYDA